MSDVAKSTRKSRAAEKSAAAEKADNAIEQDDEDTRKGRYGVLSVIVAIIFGLFFAYDLFEAIANVIGVVGGINHTNQISKLLGIAPVGVPWPILIADLIVSPLVYGIAFALGRRRGVLSKAAIFLIALAVVGALSLSIEEGFTKLF